MYACEGLADKASGPTASPIMTPSPDRSFYEGTVGMRFNRAVVYHAVLLRCDHLTALFFVIIIIFFIRTQINYIVLILIA